MFVLSAGLAREWDHESVWHEPWHALIPVAASIAVSLILYAIVYVMRPREGTARPAFWTGYRHFLGLFWMIAPLAWLYAIPYEHMMSAAGAAEANLWTLAAVALWRVLLMTCILAVTLRLNTAAALMIVMLLADAMALTALSIVSLPIINFMGGIQLSESEALISSAAFGTMTLGFISLPVWAIGALIALGVSRTDWSMITDAVRGESDEASRNGWLRWLAIASILGRLALLPLGQPVQIRRWRAEDLLRNDRIEQGIALMSAHEPADFPPHWDPPPRQSYGETSPPVKEVARIILERGAADWVRQTYALKLDARLKLELQRRPFDQTWKQIQDELELGIDEGELEQFRKREDDLRLLLRLSTSITESDRAALDWLLAKIEESKGARKLREDGDG